MWIKSQNKPVWVFHPRFLSVCLHGDLFTLMSGWPLNMLVYVCEVAAAEEPEVVEDASLIAMAEAPRVVGGKKKKNFNTHSIDKPVHLPYDSRYVLLDGI